MAFSLFFFFFFFFVFFWGFFFFVSFFFFFFFFWLFGGMEYDRPPLNLFYFSENFFCILYQVATTLLVAGPTLTLWIPGQTLFTSTSSYSAGSLVKWLPA